MSKSSKTYKILYADKLKAISRRGLVFQSQMEADDYVKKVNKESPRFHYWAEPMPETQEDINVLWGVQKESHE